LDAYLRDVLAALPAVALDGPKGVGKTETARRLAASVIELDQDAEVQALRDNPRRLAELAKPLLIDEWQHYPPVWDQVRRSVDSDRSPGRYLLAGSATPAESPKHSGAGRIVHLRMRPFSLAERTMATPTVSLAELLRGERPELSGASSATAQDYAQEIVRGGLPGLRDVPARFRTLTWSGYLAEILDRDLPESGHAVRRRDTLRAWLRAYAEATATTAAYTRILDQASPGEANRPSQATTHAWREALTRMWLLDPLEAWPNTLRRVSSLAKTPKHHLADPALAAHLMGLTAETLLAPSAPTGGLRPSTAFGPLFESLVTLSVRVYALAANATVGHLRTKDGAHEIDLMATRPDGRALAVEVKSAPDLQTSDLRHIRWLQDKMGSDLVDAIVVTTGPAAYRRREDGIGVVPAALLGP
jgi:predicted AAA+ superfamily ATPase